jgi:hemerythrin-like domain-containing protein
METATKNLMNDHVHILRLIGVMEHLTTLENPNLEHIDDAIDLIKNFADIFHHSKEENMLFPFLGTKGFSANQGPVAVMLSEHMQGRNFVKGMEQSATLIRNGKNDAYAALKDNMKGYSSLLRSHINKENNVLFPMADKVISEEDNQVLMNKFTEFEGKSYCGSLMGNCINRIDSLVQHYNL